MADKPNLPKLPKYFQWWKGLIRVHVHVPDDVYEKIGQHNLYRSTGTKDIRLAEDIGRPYITEFKDRIKVARKPPDPNVIYEMGQLARSDPFKFIELVLTTRTKWIQAESSPSKVNQRPAPYSSLVDAWQHGREGAITLNKSREAMETKLKRLAGFLHNRDYKTIKAAQLPEFDASPVTDDDLVRYLRHLLELKDKGKLAPSTVEDHVLGLRQLFKAGSKARLISPNPVSDDFRYHGKHGRGPDFNVEERRRILERALDAAPEIRVANWLAAFLGPRNAELFEADTRDIEWTPTGGVLHIRMLHRDATKMRLKLGDEEFAERSVPIHSAAWRHGRIAEYVQWVRDTYHGGGHGPLFPMIPLDGDGRRNDNGTNRINKWLHDPDGGRTEKTFYAHRHTFKTLARFPVMDVETHDAITGHGGGNAGRAYGEYNKLRTAIERLVDPLDPNAMPQAAE